MSLPYERGPVSLGDRILLGFGGALAGLLTGLLLYLMVNQTLYHLHYQAPELRWHYMEFRWVWRITVACALFAFFATETFVKVISAVWDAMGVAMRFWFFDRWRG